jgi:hypothetical protein
MAIEGFSAHDRRATVANPAELTIRVAVSNAALSLVGNGM